MAISWGAWEYSGGNGMRVGIEVTWEAVSHGEAAATATVKYYTENQYSYSDSQTLNLSGAIDGTVNFTNNDGGAAVLRATRTYTYNYGASEYGSSPGSRTFTAKISGAYNGVTPSKSVTSNIPARPIAAPAAPTNVNTSRISDTSIKTTWTNKDTAGEPWDSVEVQRDDGANDVWNSIVGTLGGGATSFTDNTTHDNYAYRYRVRASNNVGDSAWVEGDLIYTTPSAPTDASRSGSNGANQTVSWTNTASSLMAYQTEVWRAADGVWSLVYTAAQGATSWVDTYPASNPSIKFKYRVRHKTNGGAQGTLYSAYSAETTETTGLTSPPNAPTSLSPSANRLTVPTQAIVFSWIHNSTDTTAQTAYQIQWRVSGSGTWTTLTKTTSSTSSWTAPAGTFPDNSTIEWQVRTWGAATTGGSDGTGASAWSATATFKTAGDPNAQREPKRVMALDLDTGDNIAMPVNVLPPVGSLMQFAGGTAPAGWLICDGSAVSRTTYADLFAVIGTSFGAGDGSTTFNLPDLRDRVPVGASSTKARGSSGGSASVSLSVGNLPNHKHDLKHDHPNNPLGIEYSTNTTTGGTAIRVTDIRNMTGGAGTDASVDHNWTLTYYGATGSDQTGANGGQEPSMTATPFSVQNPYVALHYIIKF